MIWRQSRQERSKQQTRPRQYPLQMRRTYGFCNIGEEMDLKRNSLFEIISVCLKFISIKIHFSVSSIDASSKEKLYVQIQKY